MIQNCRSFDSVSGLCFQIHSTCTCISSDLQDKGIIKWFTSFIYMYLQLWQPLYIYDVKWWHIKYVKTNKDLCLVQKILKTNKDLCLVQKILKKLQRTVTVITQTKPTENYLFGGFSASWIPSITGTVWILFSLVHKNNNSCKKLSSNFSPRLLQCFTKLKMRSHVYFTVLHNVLVIWILLMSQFKKVLKPLQKKKSNSSYIKDKTITQFKD